MRVAIIGAGIAGMGAAKRLLENGVETLLFDAAPKAGGNCFGVDVANEAGDIFTIDAGVSDFNLSTFTEVRQFVADLRLPVQPIRQDASFATTSGETVLAVKDGMVATNSAYISDRAAFSAELARFKRQAVAMADDETPHHTPARDYLEAGKHSDEFINYCFAPRAAGCFAMPDASPLDYPMPSLARFWRIHGIIGETKAERVSIVGGMHQYPARFVESYRARGGQLFLRTRVVGVKRRAGAIDVRCVTHSDDHLQFSVDHVIFATSSVEVVPLLEDATEREKALFLSFPYQRAELVVHTDSRLMPQDRSAWGSFNYIVPGRNEEVPRPTITFYPKHMQHLAASAPDVFVTMNPHRTVASEHVLLRRFFVHPVASAKTLSTANEIEMMQGQRQTWFCGAYLLEPWVHEPALVSGLRVAEQLLRLGKEADLSALNIRNAPHTLRPGDIVHLLKSKDQLRLEVTAQVLSVSELNADGFGLILEVPMSFQSGETVLFALLSEHPPGYIVFEGQRSASADRKVRLSRCVAVGVLPRRRHTRARLRLDVQLSSPRFGSTVFTGFTHDVSAHGALIELALSANEVEDKFSGILGEQIDLSLLIPQRAAPIPTEARLVRLERRTSADAVLLGVSFARIATLDRMELEISSMRASMRQHLRAHVQMTGRLRIGGRTLHVELIDLSASGVALVALNETASGLSAAAEGTLFFTIPPRAHIEATLRFVRTKSDGSAAFEMLGLSDEAVQHITAHVLRLHRAQVGRVDDN